MEVPLSVRCEHAGHYSYRWGPELYSAGLDPHVESAARQLGIPPRTLVSRLRRGDKNERLKRPLQRRPHHQQVAAEPATQRERRDW